jgi:hypothetical protein
MFPLDPLAACTNLQEFDVFICNELSQSPVIDCLGKQVFVAKDQKYRLSQLVDRFKLLKRERLKDDLCLIPRITEQLQILKQKTTEQCEVRGYISKINYFTSYLHREYMRFSPEKKTRHFEDLCDNFDQIDIDKSQYARINSYIFVQNANKNLDVDLDKNRQKNF